MITSLYLLSRLRGKKTGWLYIFVLVLLLGTGFTYRECNFIPGTGILTSSILLPIITALLVHILAFRNPRIDTETKLILGFACAPPRPPDRSRSSLFRSDNRIGDGTIFHHRRSGNLRRIICQRTIHHRLCRLDRIDDFIKREIQISCLTEIPSGIFISQS